ncbi:peptidoglycan DD-metalloendopeptidase family protein [Erysipelothrix rhusiopathiae]|uniref:murein hydrolase activator EnvC family protein n=1 Tax=Erysipelothrix rhusiopathiae TaxID=1648 RepID=UPI000210B6E7|nr:peptidoglycan DD-metalloendopeptidase family protein [Erysipelothrix rhusiopathiae]AGN24841.1 peptidase, M23B family protein [Erysipelothrix rhusiopathiae SY1027]AMS10420.1 peptidase M23 [Erysipelothrix rhusiopathiae]AOO67239.1 peptidase M23 [Erysipelothrix rhusiopathiae]AWU42217.1 peptidase M23 [Erysipelothrix rhusiopathiae]MDE8283694.1 peptidoglycan DD-metalloendopeptidase family protein [Erysipelothrix rhusiopathiae]
MKKFFRNVIIILVVVLMLAGVLAPVFVAVPIYAEDIESLNNNIAQREKELKEQQSKQANIKEQLSEEVAKLDDYRQQIKNLEAEIESMKTAIATSEEEIKRLQASIEERAKKIKETEEKVKGYMVNAQSSTRVNGYFEFVMGAADFAEMVRRLEGMGAIKRYNEDLIREMNEVKAELEADKAKQEEEKQAIVLRKEATEIQKEEAKLLEDRVRIVITELHQKEKEAQEQIATINDKNKADAEKIKQMQIPSTPGTGGNGFTLPLPSGSFDVTADVWQYPPEYGGSAHAGVDLGVNRGTSVFAVGNGLIVSTNSGCYEGNWSCSGGYGNYISYIVNVGGHNYGILVAHLSSVSVSRNQVVSAGSLIGYSGNTGASTGPHLHVETIDMGPGTVLDAWNRWNGDPQFGTGPASYGGRRCDQGYGVPCRLYPRQTLGI